MPKTKTKRASKAKATKRFPKMLYIAESTDPSGPDDPTIELTVVGRDNRLELANDGEMIAIYELKEVRRVVTTTTLEVTK